MTITATTKLKAICVYLEQGLVSLEQVNILYAGFVDDENDAAKRKGLMDNLRLPCRFFRPPQARAKSFREYDPPVSGIR